MRNDISNLLTFIGKDSIWRERLHDVVAEHLMPALTEFEINDDDMSDILGEPWPGVLWGCGFEDFLGRHYGKDNIVDLYLKRRGWNETSPNRDYFTALRDTPVSLYEITNVKPGASMVLKDLLGGREAITVVEKSATQSLNKWDKIVVRVIAEGDQHIISGALLAFSPDAVEILFDGLRHTLGLDESAVIALSKEQLHKCAPIFTSAWLFDTLPLAMYPQQQTFLNSDGDEVMFHDLRFQLAPGVLQKDIRERLKDIKNLIPDGARYWNWVAPIRKRTTNEAEGLMLDTQIDGKTILGTLELKGKALLIGVNSSNRAAKIEALVTKATGDLLQTPLTTIRTVEQMMEEEHPDDLEENALPPEIAQQIAHEFMDNHYRETLDTPVPALGNKTPRKAVKSAAGRAQVVEWLKQIENRSAQRDDSAIGEYDFGWMWQELGLQRDP